MCINNNCGGCNQCQPNICNTCPPTECECAVRISTDCVTYTGDDLNCSSIPQNTILTDVIIQLDAFICKAIADLNASINLVNIGTGSNIYKGIDGIGRRELRKINKTGNLVTVTQNTNDISVSIDEEALTDFVTTNQNLYEVENVGSGIAAYVEPQAAPVLNTTTFKFKTFVSDNIAITTTADEIRIETPTTAAIPALYVNNLYLPSYSEWLKENAFQNGGTAVLGFVFRGKGTLAQPFTDSTVYPLAGGLPTVTLQTSIQNALDGDSAYSVPYSYVGTGTRLLPQRRYQQIIVQDNNGSYNFAGDFNYEDLNLKLECSVVASTSGYLIDMDNPLYFNAANGRFLITIAENKLLQLTDSLGFRNSGNTSSTPPSYDSGRIGMIYGDGTVYSSYSGIDILNRYMFTGDGNNNDDNLHFQIKCIVRADQQGVYFTKNKMRMDFYNRVNSGYLLGSGNTALRAFHMTGGQIRFYEKGGIYLGNDVTGRLYGVTFEPQDDGIGYTSFLLNSGQMAGGSQHCFVRLNNENVNFTAFNSPSGDGFATVLVGTGTVTNGLFENLGANKWDISFRNNVFSFTGIDQTKVDLTSGNNISVINFIGNEVLENLVVFPDKATALAAGHPVNSVFLKRTVFNAVDLLAGIEYKVVTSGVPSLGAVGSFFTATGSETGTGTASLETREIIT